MESRGQWNVSEKNLNQPNGSVSNTKSQAAKKKSPSEERKARRRIVHRKCEVSLNVAGTKFSDAETVSGVAIDVSTIGIGLIVNKFLSSNTLLRITVHALNFTVELSARVVWCRELPSTKKIIKAYPGLIWRMGLRFDPETDEEKQLLQQLAITL